MKWIVAAIVAITVGSAVVAKTQAIDEQSQKPLELVGVNPVPPGWTRIVEMDLTKGDECPATWRKIEVNDIYMCRSPSDRKGCYIASFSTNGTQYTKIHGMVRGYQKGSTDAFKAYHSNNHTIDEPYVDGVSITLATAPRTHVWTYASGLSSGTNPDYRVYNCPCSPVQGQDSPPFVAENYFCSSGNPNNNYVDTTYYTDNSLWDCNVCMDPRDTCCDYLGLPWFTREFCTAHKEDIEVRICTNQKFSNEGVLINKLALYIQ